MLLIILLLCFHLTVTENTQKNFVKIYEYESDNNGKFRGVAKSGSMIALVTENNIISGKLDADFRFIKFHKTSLTPNLTGMTELKEFKFIDENYVIICNENECCLFLCTANQSSSTRCLLMPHLSNLWKINIQKGRNGLLFQRIAYDPYYSFIESHNFDSEGLSAPKGISQDRANSIYQDSVYSFSHGNHIYFIDVVVRYDETEFYNTYIILTQICSNDESTDIRSRMDLSLCCEETCNKDLQSTKKNIATSAASYSFETNILLISISESQMYTTTICKFNMAEVEDEFQKAWNFCHNSTQYLNNCDKSVNENVVNNCNNNSAISLSSPESYQMARYENRIYGKLVYSSSDIDIITAIFSSNANEIFALTKNGKLLKIPHDFSHLFAATVLDFDNELNQRYMIQCKEKGAGFIFIDPTTEQSVYFKIATCKDECPEIFLSRTITCETCPAATSSSTASCDLETICPPMWYIGKNRKNNLENHRWSENDKTGNKIECFEPQSDKDNCSRSLHDYLKPMFQLPSAFSDDTLTENKSWAFKIFIIPLCLLFVAATTCCCVIYFYYYKNKKLFEKRKAHSSKTQLEEFNKRYLILGKNVDLLELLGSGFTSDVYLANFTDNSSPIQVAVKTLKINAKKADILKEIQLLSLCRHSNIVTFIGWIDQEPHTCIITEFMGGGDLHAYLTTPTNLLLLSTIFSYIFQVLEALMYLSRQKILHRDLAARNCLLNENYEILKLNDFGLSRKMNFDYQYISDADPHLPFKWLPLEALEPSMTEQHKIFTLKGDIWSFGVLIWEMFERGNEPYEGINYSATLRFLKNGNRLPQPRNCPIELYETMLWCWEKDPENRPKFGAIQSDIRDIFLQIETTAPHLLNIPIELNSVLEIINENYVYQQP